MNSQGASNYAFDMNMSFTLPEEQQSFLKAVEDNTSSLFFGDEGIDTTTSYMDPTVFNTSQEQSFDMSNSLAMDNTTATTLAWNTAQLTPQMTPNLLQGSSFPSTPLQSFDTMYSSQPAILGKRSLQLDTVQDFPQSKRHESMADFTLFSPFPSTTTSSWEQQTTPASTAAVESGLSDEAADVCATWFNKYAVLPGDRHIDSLAQLTGESSDAIRSWFGRLLKQGMGQSHGDSAYRSQTSLLTQQNDSFWNNQYATDVSTSPTQLLLNTPDLLQQQQPTEETCGHETTEVLQPASTLRGSKKRCSPTQDRQLLSRDPNKIYQCTRKCGKRYGRKCDWKRNEEEGYPCKSWVCSLCKSQGAENVKPCYRKYHFVQHFRNIHPNVNADDHEESSVVSSETDFPRNCGFCRHQFASRQERIDHIADHFKQGKSMLEWNEEERGDSHGSGDDNDDDDSDSSGGGSDSGKPFQPPQYDPRGGGPPSSYNGGSGSSGGSSYSSFTGQSDGGFFQFQLSQSIGNGDGSQLSNANQHIKSSNQQRPIGLLEAAEGGQQCSLHGTTSTVRQFKPVSGLASSTGDNKVSLAGNAVTESLTELLRDIRSVQEPDIHLPSDDPGDMNRTSKLPPSGMDALELPGSTNGGADGVLPTSKSTFQRSTAKQHVRPKSTEQSLRTRHVRNASSNENANSSAVFESKVVSSPTKSARLRLTENEALQSTPIDSNSFLSVRLLGAGGFGTADEIIHRETNLRLVRKTLKKRDGTGLEELRKEVDVLKKLRHPHAIRFLGTYSTGEKMSILLSPLADTTLSHWLERFVQRKPSDMSDVVIKMFGCIASSVRYLHEQRPVIKHMDIKPQNILVLDASAEYPHVILCDFGVSSVETEEEQLAQPLTRQYIAPEVMTSATRKQAADIWSLGCVFAEMASVTFEQRSSTWHSFRKAYTGRSGKYYWQDVPGVQDKLSVLKQEATIPAERTAIMTIKDMLRSDPAQRLDAASLNMIFTPAPCCLEWPNDKATFPGRTEALDGMKALAHEDDIGCALHQHVHNDVPSGSDSSFAHAKTWLDKCLHSHESCQSQAPSNVQVLPTRLIDIRPDNEERSYVRLVESSGIKPEGHVNYAALSHVWKAEDVTLTSDRIDDMLSELPRQTLPDNVNTAISTMHRLGYRYLWIDSLCVVQDSEEDKERECTNMASTFRNASMTIVLDKLDQGVADCQSALSVTHANATMKRTTEERHSASAALPTTAFASFGFGWDTRAWALQERLLSRRFLHLGEQMYWECNDLKASETFPCGLPPLIWEKIHSVTPDVTKPPTPPTNASLMPTAKQHVHDTKAISVRSTRIRDCQWIKKEGSGIGDSMEAATAILEVSHTETSVCQPKLHHDQDFPIWKDDTAASKSSDASATSTERLSLSEIVCVDNLTEPGTPKTGKNAKRVIFNRGVKKTPAASFSFVDRTELDSCGQLVSDGKKPSSEVEVVDQDHDGLEERGHAGFGTHVSLKKPSV